MADHNVGAVDHDDDDQRRAAVVGRDAARRSAAPGLLMRTFKASPGFFYILLLYIGGYVYGHYMKTDPHAIAFSVGSYSFSWVWFLITAAAMMAIAEQLRISHPGINNTFEVNGMILMAGVQVILLVLGAADVTIKGYALAKIFSNTEFLTLTLINCVQAGVANVINARTLQRTIASGSNF